jgi:hypothetical protein
MMLKQQPMQILLKKKLKQNNIYEKKNSCR